MVKTQPEKYAALGEVRAAAAAGTLDEKQRNPHPMGNPFR
jgi:hypothetical protein